MRIDDQKSAGPEKCPPARCPLFLVYLAVTLLCVGCGYSRWDYRTVTPEVKATEWTLKYVFSVASASIPVSQGMDWSDTTFYYSVLMTESDTTRNTRFDLDVKNVMIKGIPDRPAIHLTVADEYTGPAEFKGPAVYHHIRFGPFNVPRPRPDTLLVDQEITIVDSENRQTVRLIQTTVKAVLTEYRGSRIKDFINGT